MWELEQWKPERVPNESDFRRACQKSKNVAKAKNVLADIDRLDSSGFDQLSGSLPFAQEDALCQWLQDRFEKRPFDDQPGALATLYKCGQQRTIVIPSKQLHCIVGSINGEGIILALVDPGYKVLRSAGFQADMIARKVIIDNKIVRSSSRGQWYDPQDSSGACCLGRHTESSEQEETRSTEDEEDEDYV